MYTISGPGSYVFPENPTLFCIDGNDITLTSSFGYEVLKFEYSPENIIRIRGQNITIRNFVFDIDYHSYIEQNEFTTNNLTSPISDKDCTNLKFENCRVIMRIPLHISDTLLTYLYSLFNNLQITTITIRT